MSEMSAAPSDGDVLFPASANKNTTKTACPTANEAAASGYLRPVAANSGFWLF
jgi:hypothetical protein